MGKTRPLSYRFDCISPPLLLFFDSWSWQLIQTAVFNAFQLQEEYNQNFAQWWTNVKADRRLDLKCLLAQRTTLICNTYFQPLLYPFTVFQYKMTVLFLSKTAFLFLHSFLVEITYQFQWACSSWWCLLKIKTHALEGRVFIREAPPQPRIC